jgi:hypothetical protein
MDRNWEDCPICRLHKREIDELKEQYSQASNALRIEKHGHMVDAEFAMACKEDLEKAMKKMEDQQKTLDRYEAALVKIASMEGNAAAYIATQTVSNCKCPNILLCEDCYDNKALRPKMQAIVDMLKESKQKMLFASDVAEKIEEMLK